MNHYIYGIIGGLALAVYGLSPTFVSATSHKTLTERDIILSIPFRDKAGWHDPLTYPLSEYACMSEAIRLEAGGESEAGQMAVGNVIKNRTRSQGFTDSICGVVHDKRNGVYQFSYLANSARGGNAQSDKIAFRVLSGKFNDPTYGALYYLNPKTSTNPAFHNALMARQDMATVRIGNHTFIYKERKGQEFAAYMNNRK